MKKKLYRKRSNRPGKHRLSTDQVPTKFKEHIREIEKLLFIIEGEMDFNEMLGALDLNHKPHFREQYLQPALESGFVEMTKPDKPQSSKQRYRLTQKGRELKEQLLNDE